MDETHKKRELAAEGSMDDAHKERELVAIEDTAENAPQRSVVVAGNPAAVSCIQFPQGETPTINITSGGIALFGDTAALTYCSPEVKEDIEKANEKVSKVDEKVEKVRDDVGKVRDDVGKVRGDVGKIQVDMEKLKNTGFVGTMQTQGQPYTEKDIDDMKAKYKIKHQKHEIHKVNSNGRIILEEVDVEAFAVQLRMSNPLPAMKTLRGEADRYFEQLEDSAMWHNIED